MGFRDIARQHLVLDKVEVPNWRLQELPRWKRIFKRQVFWLRYLPASVETELRQLYGSQKPLPDDEQLTIWKAFDALKEGEATAGHLQVLNHYRAKLDNAELFAAIYSAVIVRPRLTPPEVRKFLDGLDKRDRAEWFRLTGKYIELSPEEVEATLKWSALRASPSSAPASTQMEGRLEGDGPSTNARSDSCISSPWSRKEESKC